MSSEAKLDGNFTAINRLFRMFKSQYAVKVGILSGSKQRNTEGVKNVDLAVTHELGSKSKRIPARSFLRMPVEHSTAFMVKSIMKRKKTIEKEMSRGNLEEFAKTVGIVAEQVIQTAFETRGFGQWKPNSPKTIEKKGSASPLIDTGQLRGAILSKVIKG